MRKRDRFPGQAFEGNRVLSYLVRAGGREGATAMGRRRLATRQQQPTFVVPVSTGPILPNAVTWPEAPGVRRCYWSFGRGMR